MAHCNSAVCECVPLRRLANATGGGDPYVNFFEHSTLQASLGRLRGGKAGIREFPQVLRSLFCRFSPARAATYSSTECSTENAMCSGRMTDSLYYDDYAANLEASSRPESLRVRGAPGVWQEKISPAMARALPRSFLCSFHRAASSSSIPTTPHGCDTQGFRTHFIFRWIWVNLETRP